MNLTRKQVLSGNFTFPTDPVNLIFTNHFLKRLKERKLDTSNIPGKITVSLDNIHSAKTTDGKTLNSVVVRLKYKEGKYLFLCFNPFDGGTKSVWLRYADKRKNHRENSEQAVPDDRGGH